MSRMKRTVNRLLDRVVRPEVGWRGRTWPSYQLCGSAGLALALVLALGLARRSGLSPLVFAAVSASAVFTFFALITVTRMVSGRELIINYHHEIAVVLVAAGLLWLLDRPVLPYLDLTVVGVGLFVACGRIGCFMAGCCHGRTCGWGVCYRERHVAAGFPSHLGGVRLVPVQLIESVWIFALVAMDAVLLARGTAPGSVLVWHATGYAVGRFSFELMRGDGGRHYLGGFSEAQWTSIGVAGAIALAGTLGLLPPSRWQIALTLLLGATMALIAAAGTPDRALLHPHHVHQVAMLLELARPQVGEDGAVRIGETSLGLRISAGRVRDRTQELRLFALSARDGELPEPTARRLAGLIARLTARGDAGRAATEVVRGRNGVYHLFVPVGGTGDAV